MSSSLAPAKFDAKTFLNDRWGDPEHLQAFLRSYGHEVACPTINMWFRRGRVPTDWGMTLLALLELENAGPVGVSKYLI